MHTQIDSGDRNFSVKFRDKTAVKLRHRLSLEADSGLKLKVIFQNIIGYHVLITSYYILTITFVNHCHFYVDSFANKTRLKF